MQLSEIVYGAARPIEGYSASGFRFHSGVIEGAVLVTASRAQVWAGLEDVASLLALAGEVDVLLLGMGAQMAYPPKELRQALEAAGIGFEVMSSPAACRSYNVLLSEGRRIAAALLPVGQG